MKRCCTAVLVCPLRGFFCAVLLAFLKNEITLELDQENLRTTHLKVMSDSCITSCEPCAMDTDESWLERLPLDDAADVAFIYGAPFSRGNLIDFVSCRGDGPHWLPTWAYPVTCHMYERGT